MRIAKRRIYDGLLRERRAFRRRLSRARRSYGQVQIRRPQECHCPTTTQAGTENTHVMCITWTPLTSDCCRRKDRKKCNFLFFPLMAYLIFTNGRNRGWFRFMVLVKLKLVGCSNLWLYAILLLLIHFELLSIFIKIVSSLVILLSLNELSQFIVCSSQIFNKQFSNYLIEILYWFFTLFSCFIDIKIVCSWQIINSYCQTIL